MTSALFRIALLALLSGPALAHGGIYNAPSDAGNNPGSAPGVVAPPTNPGGALASTQPGGTAARSGTGSQTSRGERTRGVSGRRDAVTTGSTESGPSLDSWTFWWDANRDRFLRLRDRLAMGGVSSGGGIGLLTGQGRPNSRGATRRPDKALIDQVITPRLIELLDEDEGDILDSSLLALARSCSADDVPRVAEHAVRLLGHRELSVQSTAALALGVLGDRGRVEELGALLADDSVGRRLTGGDRVPSLVRAHAALSLGMLGHPDPLMHASRQLSDSERNVKTSTVVGLGLIGADHTRAGDVVAHLLTLLADRRTEPILAAQIPVALARLGAADQLPTLLATCLDRDTDALVRQSLVIALGRLADLGDVEVVQALRELVAAGKDAPTRHFALIALGEVGAASRTTDHAEALLELRDLFGRELSGKGKSRAHRSWAALGLALLTRPHKELQGAAIDRLAAAFDDESDPEYRGAMAIALGLLGSHGESDRLLESFRASRDQDLRGHLAVALGLVDARQADEALRAAAVATNNAPSLRLSAAIGLGLLGDRQTVDLLVGTLREARTLGVAAASAKAVGMIGDRAAVEGVASVALDDSMQPITRGFAAVALGLLGERGDLPWNEPIKAHGNYRAFVEAIAEVHDIL